MKNLIAHWKSTEAAGLVIGLSCLVSFTMCSLTGQLEVFSGIAHFDPRGFMMCGIFALLMFAGVQSFRRSAVRKLFSFINCGAACFWVVMTWWFVIVGEGGNHDFGSLGTLLFGTLGRAAAMGLTIQWHLHVALLNEKEVARTVSAAMAASVSFYIVLCIIGGKVALAFACAAFLTSAAFLVLRESRLGLVDTEELDISQGLRVFAEDCDEDKGQARKLWSLRVRLFASRVVWGILFGFLLSAVSIFRAPLLANAAVGVGVVVASVLVMVRLKRHRPSVPADAAVFLPVILLMMLGVCFYGREACDYARLAAGAAYVCWFALLYFQVPTYRRLTRMHPAIFAYADTLCSFVVFEGMTWLVLGSAPLMSFLRDNSYLVLQIAFWYTIALFVIATFVLSRHFTSYYPEHTSGFAVSEIGERKNGILRDAKGVAQGKGLTERETEVFLLLAEGYSRPYIQKRLFISEGTVKTHTRSIYRKLGVSSRDELIDLVHGEGASDE